MSRPLRLCGYCRTWNSKPCGEQCHWQMSDPTLEEIEADAISAVPNGRGPDIGNAASDLAADASPAAQATERQP